MRKMKQILKIKENKELLKEFITSPKTYLKLTKIDRKELMTNETVIKSLNFLAEKNLVFENIYAISDKKGFFSPSSTTIAYLCRCQKFRLRNSVETILSGDENLIYCNDCFNNTQNSNFIQKSDHLELYVISEPSVIGDLESNLDIFEEVNKYFESMMFPKPVKQNYKKTGKR